MTHGITFDNAEPGYYRDELTWTELALPDKMDALNFLGAMNEIDHDPGSFNTALVKLALVCDVTNVRKLRREFGRLISAVILYKDHPQGFRMLWKIAELEDQMPSYLRCGASITQGVETCSRGLSCAQLGAEPWTSEGCPDA